MDHFRPDARLGDKSAWRADGAYCDERAGRAAARPDARVRYSRARRRRRASGGLRLAGLVATAALITYCCARWAGAQLILTSRPPPSALHNYQNLYPMLAGQSSPASLRHPVPFHALQASRSQAAAAAGPAHKLSLQAGQGELEARGGSGRGGLYSLRAARNATSSSSGSSSSSSSSSWHFPRISPEQAAEVLLTGAQVINRIAQADTPLNYCRTPDNQEGECSDIRKCIWLVLDKARLKQSVCLRNLIIPAVCCPVSAANNTPIANMIQSTLEPVLFRPKAPKQRKPGALPRPLASLANVSQVGPAPSSAAALIIRSQAQPTPAANQTGAGSTTGAPPPTSTGTVSAPATAPPPPPPPALEQQVSAGSSARPNQLFQEEAAPAALAPDRLHYNRTVSQLYPWLNETCGEGGRTRTGRIVGGSDSKLGQWPWMTAMYLNKRLSAPGPGEFWCGGALINRRFVLTAAHCLSDQRGNRYRNEQVTIKLGGVDLVRHQAPSDILRNGEQAGEQRQSGRSEPAATAAGDDDAEFSWISFISKALGLAGSSGSGGGSGGGGPEAAPPAGSSKSLDKKQQLAAHAKRTYFKEYRVASIKQHPNFQRHGFYNDIGLIELKSEVDYDDLISPVCLPSEHDQRRDMSGYMATVLGWGTLSYGGQGSKLLQQVSMPIWNNKDCDDRYLQHIGKTFLCAGFLSGGKDACQGDSGGPLMVSDKAGRWTLHGVVSFGKTCAQAGYPGVYTRLTEYLDWIRDNTDPSGFARRPANGNQ